MKSSRMRAKTDTLRPPPNSLDRGTAFPGTRAGHPNPMAHVRIRHALGGGP
jgi:hypothetical protein